MVSFNLTLTSFVALFVAVASAAPAPAPAIEERASGTATYFETGLGACGWQSSDSDWIVAVMPSVYSNGANCGKNVRVTNQDTGIVKTGTVVDECPSCVSKGSLDMSTSFFKALGGTEEQGVFPITWEWA